MFSQTLAHGNSKEGKKKKETEEEKSEYEKKKEGTKIRSPDRRHIYRSGLPFAVPRGRYAPKQLTNYLANLYLESIYYSPGGGGGVAYEEQNIIPGRLNENG